jgi:hypothetical protein
LVIRFDLSGELLHVQAEKTINRFANIISCSRSEAWHKLRLGKGCEQTGQQNERVQRKVAPDKPSNAFFSVLQEEKLACAD